MTDEEIRKAACEAFDADARWIGLNTAMFVERHLKCLDDVFRAGMEAGRAAEAERAMPRKRRKAEPCTVEKPGCVDSQTWEDWLALRKEKQAAVTQTVLNGARKEAAKAEISLEAFFRIWCLRGSQGLEAAWLTPSERGRGPQSGRIDRQLETAGLMTGASKRAPTDMGEIYDVGQQRIAGR